MKFRVTFKTPYVLEPTLQDHEEKHCADHSKNVSACSACLDAEDRSFNNLDSIKKCAEKFIEYDEYITIEFDTETKAATVLPIR